MISSLTGENTGDRSGKGICVIMLGFCGPSAFHQGRRPETKSQEMCCGHATYHNRVSSEVVASTACESPCVRCRKIGMEVLIKAIICARGERNPRKNSTQGAKDRG